MEAQLQMLIDLATAQAEIAAAQVAATAAQQAAVVPPVVRQIPVLYPGNSMLIPLNYNDPKDFKVFKAHLRARFVLSNKKCT